MSVRFGHISIFLAVLFVTADAASSKNLGGGADSETATAVKSRKKIRSQVEQGGNIDSTSIDSRPVDENAKVLSYSIDKEGVPRKQVQKSSTASEEKIAGARQSLLMMMHQWGGESKGWSYDEIEKATNSRDPYGALAALPMLTEIKELDTNNDGMVTEPELMQFRGLSHRFCRNTGERQYDCLPRCSAGDQHLDGSFNYFKGKKIAHSEFDPEFLASFNMAQGGGAVSNAQKTVLGMSVQEVVRNNVEGAICEFGVFMGGTSVFLHRTLENISASKTHPLHLFDSFEGLPDCDPTRDTGSCGLKKNNIMAARMELVKQAFTNSSLPPPPMHKGFFDKIPDEEFPSKIAFAFIDGDLYPSIYTALQRVYPRLSKGGIVVVHDYAFEMYPGTELAINDFLKDKPEDVMLPASSKGVACYLGMIRKQ